VRSIGAMRHTVRPSVAISSPRGEQHEEQCRDRQPSSPDGLG
jgi:hypothetical protein